MSHTANPAIVAADLIAQAEHDVAAVPILISYSEEIIDKVNKEVEEQLKVLPTQETARVAFKNGK